VFFALRDLKDGAGEVPFVSRKQKTSDLKNMLSQRTKDELIEFLLEILPEYDEIEQLLKLKFSDKDEGAVLKVAVELIRTYIENYADSFGFVDYRHTRDAIKGAEMVLEKAHSALEQGRYIHAVNLALCVMQEMLRLVSFADDSDGVVGWMIDKSIQLIQRAAVDEKLEQGEKEKIFELLAREAAGERNE